ncbi:MAG: hypothetical protein GX442_07780 [Candidatus Riflebacteria bacterium]|nr:hypothetical protein [Candidatus Riflebacteria bacterium]
MNSGRKQFLVGALAGLLLIALTLDGRALVAAVSQTLALHQMPEEIRQGYDLELLPHTAFTVGAWKEETPSRDFDLAVQKTLQLLGSPIAGRLTDLVEAGILSRKGNRAVILRREAFETVFRAVIHLWNEGLLPPPTVSGSRRRFGDYTPPQAYRQAMTFLYDAQVVRGYEDGRLRVRRPLTNRDCIFLLSRFYRAAASGTGTGTATTTPAQPEPAGVAFLDLSTESWLTEPIRRLDAAGAFAFTRLGTRLAGERPMSLADAAGMVSGILARFDRSASLAAIQEIVGEGSPVRSTTRGQLARLGGILGAAFTPGDLAGDFPYVDLPPDSPEGKALRQMSGLGIRMGYPTGRFAGNETVTRFEIIGTLHAVLRIVLPEGTMAAAPDPDQVAAALPDHAPMQGPDDLNRARAAAATSDLSPAASTDDFATIIRAKQRQIRALLERQRPAAALRE